MMSTGLKLMLMAQLATTISMTGLIWFVQITHYPLFRDVGAQGFSIYERRHRFRTTCVVGPLMLTEALAAVLTFAAVPIWVSFSVACWGAALLLVIWCSTAFLSVPQHERLCERFDSVAWSRLVATNWIRTVAWTARSLLLLFVVWTLLP